MTIDSTAYPIEVHYSEEDGGFIATAKDLPGCSAFGKTQAEAVTEIQDAIRAWQEAAKAASNPVPAPSRHVDDVLPSGKILLRIPRTLHAALIECAKGEAVSLNQHLVSVLSLSVGTSLFREAHEVMASMRTFVQVGAGATVIPYMNVLSRPLQLLDFVQPATLVGSVERLDVRTLPAGKPVVRVEGR